LRILEQDFDFEVFLARPLFAHLATVDEVGACESPAWFLWEDSALWLIAASDSSFPKRISNDARCALGIIDFDLERGFLQHVGMRGRGVVIPCDRRRLIRLLTRYLGPPTEWNPWFKESVIDKQDVMVRFEPETIVARDQSYFKSNIDKNKV